MSWRVIYADCIEAMRAMDEASIDAIVCDPPYELGFMGKAWDSSGVAYQPRTWEAALRVLKPGGHLLAFGGTRTYHRLACAVEDAGFEIRDCIAWLYGSGFPKSHNGEWGGTALKPAHEPIVVARKPLVGTVAANVLKHGTGGLNIDGCRIEGPKAGGSGGAPLKFGGENHRPFHDTAEPREFDTSQGRWPANVVLDPEAAAMLDEQSGERPGSDGQGASRFFYCAKASRGERNAGLDGFEERAALRNVHPTVKPIDLMRWLVRLVTPPGGTVLDPFTGSGTTGCAAVLEGFDFIGIEREGEYVEIARARIRHWNAQPVPLSLLEEAA